MKVGHAVVLMFLEQKLTEEVEEVMEQVEVQPELGAVRFLCVSRRLTILALYSPGGRSYNSEPDTIFPGSGGGGGGTAYPNPCCYGGTGGNGGASLLVEANYIYYSGSFQSQGLHCETSKN